MFVSRLAKLVVAFAAVSIATPSSAAVRTFDFVARIDSETAFVAPGTMITGSFSYDDGLTPTSTYYEAPPEWLHRGEGAEYRSPSVTLSFTVDGEHYAGGGRAHVYNLIEGDPEDADSFSVRNLDNTRYYMALTFWAGNATTFLDTRLPTRFPTGLQQAPNPDDDDFDEFDLIPSSELEFYDVERQVGLNALVLSITPAGISAVPESSTWAMMIAGFGAIGAALRRRARPSRHPVLN